MEGNSEKIILPEEGKRNILITSALPYVNNIPHLGNIIGSVLSADCFARYCKLRGYNALYISGTDEYGTATETKALQEGLSPQEICDKYHKIHAEIYDWFDIKFDKFGRTSTPQQTTISQDIFLKLHERGFLLEDTTQQLFCEKCTRFLADRFVEGTCPHCGFNDARGDQCDACGKLINAVELIKPRCKICSNTPTVRNTEHLNLDLPKIVGDLEKFIESSIQNGIWSPNAVHITKGWLSEGLKPRCITRDLKWGVSVPIEKFKEKVFYVWFDAPIGYISITANYTEHWEKWWKNPDQVKLYQFMGKDNIPFHSVIFPSSLIGSGENWSLLDSISTTEYLNYEGGKFSKSRGLGVFGSDAKTSGIPAEVWRYYLLANRPESADSSFSWSDLNDKNNGELLANLGNFVNRALSFCKKEFSGKVPSVTSLLEQDKTLIEKVNKEIKEYISALEQIHLREGIRVAMGISKLGNVYIQDNKPWELVKTDLARCSTVIAISLNLTKILAILLEPYVPALSEKIYAQLNYRPTFPEEFIFDLPENHVIGEPKPLLKKLEPKDIEQLRAKFGGGKSTGDSFPANIRGGIIKLIEDHPTDENVYLLKVEVGTETKQVIARLKAIYSREQLQDRQVFVLCNLPPVEIRGIKSEGMLLVAEEKKKDKLALLQPFSKVDSSEWSGSQFDAEGAAQDYSKPITLKDFQKLDLKLNKEGKVIFKGKYPIQNADKNFPFAPEISTTAKIR